MSRRATLAWLTAVVGGGLSRMVVAESLAPGDDLEVLRSLNADYVHSVLTSDAKRFNEILAPDFRATNADGSFVDRAAFLVQVAQPSNLRALDCEDVEIRVFGATAIIHARTVYTTNDGRPGTGRYTDIWAKIGGRWLAVAAHVTRLVR